MRPFRVSVQSTQSFIRSSAQLTSLTDGMNSFQINSYKTNLRRELNRSPISRFRPNSKDSNSIFRVDKVQDGVGSCHV
jgi:hypothetical protein